MSDTMEYGTMILVILEAPEVLEAPRARTEMLLHHPQRLPLLRASPSSRPHLHI